MARRLLDSLFFQAENVTGKVYYDDGELTGDGKRAIAVEYFAADGSTTTRPGQSVPDRRGYQTEGQTILQAFCESRAAVTVKQTRFFPYAEILVEQNAAMCAAPVVVCDLSVTGKVEKLTITIAVKTSHGPWRSSYDGVNYSEGITVYNGEYGKKGAILVKDAANCEARYEYDIPDPSNPKPEGEIVDIFYYGTTGRPESKVEVYGLITAPYTLAAWSPSNTAIPSVINASERGQANNYELPPRCGGVTTYTRLRYFVTLSTPFVRVETTDNSPECGYTAPAPPQGNFEFEYVTGSNESVAGGDGLIQAKVKGNDGPVLFSLDNYRTPGQANADGSSTTFQNLRAGTYTIYAREIRSQGRIISRQITLTAPAHGPRYRVRWYDEATPCEANLYLRGYTGPVEEIRGAKSPLEINWSSSSNSHFFEGNILASDATLHLLLVDENNAEDLDLVDERQLRLEFLRGNTLVWTGWCLPDLFEVPWLPRPLSMSVRATDGLGTLAEMPFRDSLGNPMTGERTHWAILRNILDRLTLPLPWSVLHTVYPDSVKATVSTEALQTVSCDQAGFSDNDKPWTCGKVLTCLLAYHEMRLMQREGGWHLERFAELAGGDLTPRRYDAAGALLTPEPVSLVRVVTLPPRLDGPNGLFYIDERQLLSRLPAVASVLVKAEPGEARNYFPTPAFPDSAFDPVSGRLIYWTGTAANRQESNLNDTKKPAGLRLLQQSSGNGPYIDSPDFTVPVAGYALQGPFGFPVGFTPSLVTLSFTAKPAEGSAFTSDETNQKASFFVGFAERYIQPGFNNFLAFLSPEDVRRSGFPLDQIPVYAVNGTGAVNVSFTFRGGFGGNASQVFVVRLHAPSAGDIVISNLSVTVGTATNGSFVSESEGQTNVGKRLTRRDENLTLQLADTLNVDEKVFSVLQRSVLLASNGTLVSLWREGIDPTTPAYYLIDLIVRDRLSWQQRPCWVLRGDLKGDFTPGALLVDPEFSLNAAFVVTSANWITGENRWVVTAVEALGIVVPLPRELYGLQAEDDRLLLSEMSNYILVDEDAY